MNPQEIRSRHKIGLRDFRNNIHFILCEKFLSSGCQFFSDNDRHKIGLLVTTVCEDFLLKYCHVFLSQSFPLMLGRSFISMGTSCCEETVGLMFSYSRSCFNSFVSLVFRIS